MNDKQTGSPPGLSINEELATPISAAASRGDDGLQVVPHEYWRSENANPQVHLPADGKQVAYESDAKHGYPSDEKQRHTSDEKHVFLTHNGDSSDKHVVEEKPRRRKWLWIAIGIVAVIVIVVAVAVPVAVTRKDSSSNNGSASAAANTTPSTSSSPSTISIIPASTSTLGSSATTSPQVASYLSTSGAFNGTGISTMDPQNGVDYFWVFYQAYNGDLRYIPLSNSGAWQSSQRLEIKDRGNATALKAFSYKAPNTLVYHLFYVDSSGVLQDLIYTNQTNSWNAGKLGAQKWKTASGRSVSLSAGYDLTTYGKVTTAGPDLEGGLRLWAGGEDGLLHEYAHDYNSDSWDAGFAFPGTTAWGGASPERAGNLTTQHLVNSNNQLELWWRNCPYGSSCYPSGQWNKGADATTPLYPNSSVITCAYGKGAYYLNSNSTVVVTPWVGFQAAERWNQTLSLGIQALPGSTLACGTIGSGSSASVNLFFQVNGSELSQWVPDRSGNFYSRVGDVPV